ncbi:hypothetical protein PRAC110570_07980 [Propionibacterium acidifaciens]
MAYVRKVRTASGATAVQIAEHRDGRDRVLEHLGSAHTSEELFPLVAAARQRLAPLQDELDFLPSAAASRSVTITGRRSIALWGSLRRVHTDLGFEVLADDAFAQLVLARVIKPTSKAGSIRKLDALGIPHAGLRSVFRCSARFRAEDYRSEISQLCFENARVDGNLTLVLYDVTILCFEAEHEDGLREVGFSEECRVDPRIVVGLLTDRAGFPLGLTCWKGDRTETLTMLPKVMDFLARHDLRDLVVAADAGALSAANLTALDGAGLKFIVGSRQVKAPIDLESHFHWRGDAFEGGRIIDTITSRPLPGAAAAAKPFRIRVFVMNLSGARRFIRGRGGRSGRVPGSGLSGTPATWRR